MGAAELAGALTGIRQIGLDASVLIATSDERDPRRPCARWLLMEIERGRFQGLISSVTAAEVLVGVLRRGVPRALAAGAFLRQFPNVRVEPFTLQIAVDAARVRQITTLRLPDAAVVATALARGAQAVVHGDADWVGQTEPYAAEAKFVYIGDYCA